MATILLRETFLQILYASIKTVLDEAYKLYDPAHAELVAKSQEVGKLIDTFADN